MIVFKIREMLEKRGISRYKLQQMTNWNYKRINAFYFGKVRNISIEEIDKLCDIFNCSIEDILERKNS